jgi:5-hydroxyisourate hydrolase-like protein (transthyretin family)
VPNTAVVVTVNYGLTEPPTTYSTSLTVTCSQDSVDKGNDVTISGALTSSGSGVADKTITLVYHNGITWCPIDSVTTNFDGTYSYAWTVPAEIENGVYPLKADFAGDSTYLSSTASTGTAGNGSSLTVLPEAWGSIVALVACFGGSLVFFKLRSKHPAA